MADSTGSWLPGGSITRRTVLKLAAAVPFLSDGAVAGTARATERGDTRANALAAVRAGERTVAVDGVVGQHAAAVDLDDGTALVGVPPTPETTASVGRAVVLRRSEGAWSRRATLSPDGDDGQFGGTVALDGRTAVVGGELGPDPAGDHGGSAAVFAREGDAWSRRATLHAPDSRGVDLFGTAVDVADDTVLVGASTAGVDSGRDVGAAFVFARSSGAWRRTATLVPGVDGIVEFGRAVALDGETAVVGGRRTDGGHSDSGVVFVYRRRGGRWREQARLTPPGSDRDDGFGAALAVAGGTVLAGAPTESNESGTNAGGAHVFVRRNGVWRRQEALREENGGTAGAFGTAVALDGDVALVGGESGDGPTVFARSGAGWTTGETVPTDAGDTAVTGVALDGTRAVVGTGGDADRPAESAEVR
jgi:hypothetical protein